ncbi:argininosuccinate synthetase [Lambiella insularis]|nr:argininosuccinate synthetase [Lambiella insularis]
MWKLTQNPESAPNTPEDFTVAFEKGIPLKLSYKEGSKEKTVSDPLDLFLTANSIARRHGVGRVDIVENRFIGLKSRGCYETPGLTMLRSAHLDLEGLVLDREVRALRDQEFLEESIKASQKHVNGQVRCRAYKGQMMVLRRSSETEKLYDATESSMDEITGFEPSETSGFIGVQAIRLKKYGAMKGEKGERL